MNDIKYEQGWRQAWSAIRDEANKRLYGDDPGSDPATNAKLLQERDEAIVALRRMCEDYGDNDWPDDLHLADIIEKHLERNLRRSWSGPQQ